jgi:hypothetical protein
VPSRSAVVHFYESEKTHTHKEEEQQTREEKRQKKTGLFVKKGACVVTFAALATALLLYRKGEDVRRLD